jgi:hypothetical protein
VVSSPPPTQLFVWHFEPEDQTERQDKTTTVLTSDTWLAFIHPCATLASLALVLVGGASRVASVASGRPSLPRAAAILGVASRGRSSPSWRDGATTKKGGKGGRSSLPRGGDALNARACVWRRGVGKDFADKSCKGIRSRLWGHWSRARTTTRTPAHTSPLTARAKEGFFVRRMLPLLSRITTTTTTTALSRRLCPSARSSLAATASTAVVDNHRHPRQPVTRRATHARAAGAAAKDDDAAMGGKDWESMWAAGLNPGDAFDARRVEPAFQALIDTGTLPKGRAFVPGCGRGYAINALAASGDRFVTGLEISETAKAAADAYLSAAPSGAGFAITDTTSVIVVSVPHLFLLDLFFC